MMYMHLHHDYPRPAMNANRETFYEPKDMMAEVGNQFCSIEYV